MHVPAGSCQAEWLLPYNYQLADAECIDNYSNNYAQLMHKYAIYMWPYTSNVQTQDCGLSAPESAACYVHWSIPRQHFKWKEIKKKIFQLITNKQIPWFMQNLKKCGKHNASISFMLTIYKTMWYLQLHLAKNQEVAFLFLMISILCSVYPWRMKMWLKFHTASFTLL